MQRSSRRPTWSDAANTGTTLPFRADVPADATWVETDVPARLDRLAWSKFHWLVVATLGAAWVLDGLEVTLVGSLSSALADPRALSLSPTEVGLTASAYLAGAIAGALTFGQLTDRFGRRRLFQITLGIYVAAALLTGLAWNFWSFALFRFFTGLGIGGEYAAINSAIQEFVPAKYRGRTDLAINGSWWIGAALGALGSIVALDPRLFRPDLGWRFAFVIGALLAITVMLFRRFIPESPRWLMTHGRPREADAIVAKIERATRRVASLPGLLPTIRLRPTHRVDLTSVAELLFRRYPRRVLLCIVLMATQAFFYNAIFFTYAMILTRYYSIKESAVGWYILPFAAGNFLGPLLLGPLFDTIGRKTMIAATYALSGILIIVVGYLFKEGMLSAASQTLAWSVIFFFASAGASAAYLTAGESFPLEIRALSIALFYALGTLAGGLAAPALFGYLIQTGSRSAVLSGYLLGGILMIFAALTELTLGVAAERRPLEDVAPPMSMVE